MCLLLLVSSGNSLNSKWARRLRTQRTRTNSLMLCFKLWNRLLKKLHRPVLYLHFQFADTKQVQFIVGLGDNFYYEGVKNVDDHRFSSTFEHVYKYPALKTATWYMIAGNHDYGSNVSAQIAYTKRSKRWHFPHFFYTQGICLQLHSILTRFVPGRGGYSP